MDLPDYVDILDGNSAIPKDADFEWFIETTSEHSSSPRTSDSTPQSAKVLHQQVVYYNEAFCSVPHREIPQSALSGATQEHQIRPVPLELNNDSPTSLRPLGSLPSPDVALTLYVSDPALDGCFETQSETTLTAPSRVSTPRRRYGQDQWKAVRPVLYDLYIQQGNSLLQTRRILEEEHGFIASYVCNSIRIESGMLTSKSRERQYKDKIKAWGFQKNNTRRSQTTQVS